VREIIPISSQKVRIRIPGGHRVTRARLLMAGNELAYGNEEGAVTVEVPAIHVHEVIALDFEV
jgi:hypothetical protein